jgi:hypothetical protein
VGYWLGKRRWSLVCWDISRQKAVMPAFAGMTDL